MSYEIPPQYDNSKDPSGSGFNPNSFGNGIMQTAKLGMIGLISTGVGILLSIVGLPFGALFNLAGLVLAIVSLVKKERPKWPAWTTIGLNIAGIVITIILLVLVFGLFAAAGAAGAFS